MSVQGTQLDGKEPEPLAAHSVGRNGLAKRKRRSMVNEIKRKALERMVRILEEAGGSMPRAELVKRMVETGGAHYWEDVFYTARRKSLVCEDDYGVCHIPKKEPVMSPEAMAKLNAFLKAEKLGIVGKVRGKLGFTGKDRGALTSAELEMAERFMERSNALASSKELARTLDLYWEGKVTKDELDACKKKVARLAEEPPLQEQRGARKAPGHKRRQ